MNNSIKLKPNSPFWITLGVALIAMLLLIILFSTGFISEKTFQFGVSIILFVASLHHFVLFMRTKNSGFFIFMLFYFNISMLQLILAIDYDPMKIPLIITIIPLIILFFYTLFSKKTTIHYKKILELAAKPVDDTANGFTQRPYPAGEATYTREEIIGFAKYLNKRLISISYIEKNRVVLVIAGNELKYLWTYRPCYQKDTYVSFDFSGNISAQIANSDYTKYKDELTFDKLCESLGDLFKTFLDFYQKGERDKIVDLIEKEGHHGI